MKRRKENERRWEKQTNMVSSIWSMLCKVSLQKNETDSRNERKPWALKSLKEMKGNALFKIKKCACLTC